MAESGFLTGILGKHVRQGFMQGNIIASTTCFGGYMDVNC